MRALLARLALLFLVAGAPVTQTSTTPLDLNTASQAELENLPHIGPAKAEAILRRRSKRPFRRVHELLRIRGIGRKTLARLRPLVRVGPSERVR